MVQIRQNSFIDSSIEQIAKLKEAFAKQHCVVLPYFLDSSMARRIIKQLETAKFYSNAHTDFLQQEFATDLTVYENELALHQIHLLLNNQNLFRVVEQITDCKTIKNFSGRIYRNQPETEHQLEWHDDKETEYRLIGISINLSSYKYHGGVFQLREKKSKKIVCDVACGNLGDAHIFRIDNALQHRVTKIIGSQPRTAAAGWFNSYPDVKTVFKTLFDRKDSAITT